MAIQEGILHAGANEQPVPSLPKIATPNDETAEWYRKFSTSLSPHYLEYLSGLKDEWVIQEAQARVSNPHYIASLKEKEIFRQETAQILAIQEPKEQVEEIPIEVRNFRFWQRSLWLRPEFRASTRGRGFMGDVDTEFNTRQRNFEVKYSKTGGVENLEVQTERTVGEQELKEVKKELEDISIKSATIKHTIKQVLSEANENSTYLIIERLTSKDGVTFDTTIIREGLVTDERDKKFVGWLAISLLQ